jgi:phosphomethylpyrimidine synthase
MIVNRDDIRAVADSEGVDYKKLETAVDAGRVAIVRNSLRDIQPLGVGEGLRTKVNANVGTSPRATDMALEVEKAKVAVEHGAHAVMDLSTGPNLDEIRRAIIDAVDVPIGLVPVYQGFDEAGFDMTAESLFSTIEKQCKDGVDFITVHCGITKALAERLQKGERTIPITSKGGASLAAWMLKTGLENPLYSEYDTLLEIAKEYNVVLSLGDALRPAAIHDANDFFQLEELRTLGKLTERAWEKGVQVIVEGPGHMPLNMIEEHVKYQKKVCKGAPYYVLGPLVTDTALGYDHISGAIGGAIAAAAGVDFLCYVTPSEHIALPNLDDVKKGVIASMIAAHAADIVKLGLTEDDDRISKARAELDWKTISEYAMDDETRERIKPQIDKDPCTMCGDLCALKLCQNFVKGEKRSNDEV